MKISARRAYLSVIFVNVMWGLSFIASKHALNVGFQPFSLALVRYIVTPLALFPWLAKREGGMRFPKRDFPLMLLSGMFGVTIYFFFEYNGLQRTTAANASLIVAAMPVFTMLWGVISRRRKPSRLNWLGAIISLAGVYLVVAAGSAEGGGTLTGNLFMLGACLCWVAYIELTSVLLRRGNSSLSVTCWQSLFSLITLIPLALTERVDWVAIPLSGWLASAGFLGLICSALAYILYADSIAALNPMRTAIFINLNPIASVLGGVLLLGEHITALHIAGGVLILASIFMVNYVRADRIAS